MMENKKRRTLIIGGVAGATTTCFTTFFPEPEHSWQTIPKEKHGPIL